MPWDQLTETETKSVARAVENLKELDFSSKSLKHWTSLFNDKFDRSFITSRIGKIAVVYNSCSLSLKQRLISLNVGKQARENSYTYLQLLQLITTVVHSPLSRDQAMLDIYKGFKQTNSETVQSYLQRTCDVAEDAWGPSSGWTDVTGVSPTEENLRRFPVDWVSQVNSICSYHRPIPMDNIMRFCPSIPATGQNLIPGAKRKCHPERNKTTMF